jgi:hypothetical protein
MYAYMAFFWYSAIRSDSKYVGVLTQHTDRQTQQTDVANNWGTANTTARTRAPKK